MKTFECVSDISNIVLFPPPPALTPKQNRIVELISKKLDISPYLVEVALKSYPK